MTPAGAVDTTARDLFVLIGLAAALFLIWLAFDPAFQEWRRHYRPSAIPIRIREAIAKDISRWRER